MTVDRIGVFTPDFQGVDSVVPAVNCDRRADGTPIDILLLHYTGMVDDEAAVARLTGVEGRVSCHYFVHRDGRILQFLPESERAWHAGVSAWHGESDINSRSIGIEIANSGHEHGYEVFPDAQIAAVIALCRDCVRRRHILAERVLAHSDVAPGRKQDPGEKFPWARLADEGVGLWVEPAPIGGGRYFQKGDAGQPVEALQSMLAMYGYSIEINGQFDDKTEAVVIAFQCHFRPAKVDGVADISTIETLNALLRACR